MTGCRSEVKESGWPAAAARRAVNDAMLMCKGAQNLDERARNDLLFLSRCVTKFLLILVGNCKGIKLHPTIA